MAGLSVELVVHPLCPFAQRALYAYSFKNVPAEIVLVSPASPPDWFLDLNPLGEVPSCKVTKNGQIFKLTESLNISEYFDSFPGPSLYPRLETGQVDPLAKALIDVFIKLKIGRFISAYYNLRGTINHSPEEQKEIEESMKEMNGYMENGNYVMHKVLGVNDITFADLMVLPFVERLIELNSIWPEFFKSFDLGYIVKWYETVIGQPWAAKYKAPPHQLHKLIKEVQGGNYQGLRLPLSIYD